MKRNLLVVAALVIITAGYGQVGPGKGRRHHGPSMREELSLDSVQYATIKGINRKYSERARELRKDTVTRMEEKRESFKSLREERSEEIDNVLTPEQRTRWQALKKQRIDDRQAARLEAKARKDARIKSRLSLSDDQLAKMKSARKESFEQARKDYESRMKKILTKDQFNEWQKMNKEKSPRKKRR